MPLPPNSTPKPSCLPSRKAMKSQEGMKADSNSPGRWVSLYLQEQDRVLEWCREFWSIPSLQGWMCEQHPGPRVGPSGSCSLQAASCTNWERQLMDCPTLSGDAGMQELPSPKGFQGNSGLLNGVAWRNSSTGHGPPEVCHLFWNALGIFCKAVQELCRCLASVIESGNLVDL